jgi:hypothetical protein
LTPGGYAFADILTSVQLIWRSIKAVKDYLLAHTGALTWIKINVAGLFSRRPCFELFCWGNIGLFYSNSRVVAWFFLCISSNSVKTVFISYRHENPDHARSVLRFAVLLRQSNIPVELDQFYLDEHPGGPDEGWPKWCADRANKSEAVLIIASHGWFAIYEGGEAPGIGCGAATEAALFEQYLYDKQRKNPRIRLAFLNPLPYDRIPIGLRAWERFELFPSNDKLKQLVDWVGERLELNDVQLSAVHWPAPLDDFHPDIADRHESEWPAIVDLLAGRSPERILLFEGESGYGKSELIRQGAEYARRLGIGVAILDFKASYPDVQSLLGQLYLDLGIYLPTFSQQGADKMHLLRRDLRSLRQPILIILDAYENAAHVKPIADWVCYQLLSEVECSLAVAVIIAGQLCPDPSCAPWRGFARNLFLGPITEPSYWEPWIKRRYPDFQNKVHVPTIVMAAGGVPKTLSDLCRMTAIHLIASHSR